MGGGFSASDPGIRLFRRHPPSGGPHPPGAPSLPQVARLLPFGLVSALRLRRGHREVTRVPATFRELPQKVAAVFELCPAEREVRIPEEFQAGEGRRTGTNRRGRPRRRPSRPKLGLVGSGQEGVPPPPHDGVPPNFVPWRGDGRVDPAGGTNRTPAPHPGCPPEVRWSFSRFSGLVWAVWRHFFAVFAHRKWENQQPEMTLERAVSLLSNGEEDVLLRAAGHIQTCCFRSADAKKTVR